MKPSRLLIGAGLMIGGATLWLIHLRAEGGVLSANIARQRVAAQTEAEALRAKMAAEAAEHTALADRLAKLKSQLATERRKTTELAAQKIEIESKLPPVDEDDIVVSFGRIADMAAELGEVARLGRKFASPGTAKLTPEENNMLMGMTVKIMAWMPEISAFEDTPAEIASLQSGTLANVFALNAETATRVEQVINEHFSRMKAAGLTASSRNRAGWRDQRSASIAQLMWKLRPLLPADADATPSLPLILNLGAGMEKHVDLRVNPKGESTGSVGMSLPNWPRVPWLPEK